VSFPTPDAPLLKEVLKIDPMRNWIWPLAAVVVLDLSSSLAVEPERTPMTFSRPSGSAEPVTLNDLGAAFSINLHDEGLPLTHKIVGVDENYVAGVADTLVPLYSVKGITRTKLR
jgi:hypothetical protein